MIKDYIVNQDYDGAEVKVFLRRFVLLSASILKKMKNSKAISVNGNHVFSNYIVHIGDVVTLDFSKAEPETDVVADCGNIDILYEDEWVLIVNKPSGQIVHPSRSKYTGTLMNYAQYYMEKDGDTCHSVNRLDRDTSGIVVLAKNSFSKYMFSQALKSNETIKEYTAIVFGKPKTKSGKIDVPIKRETEGNMLRVPTPDGEKAITNFYVENTIELDKNEISLLKLRLETGRTHQIRVHSLYMGTPLLGDNLYFTEESNNYSIQHNIKGCLLHASFMHLYHPFLEKWLDISAPVKREDFSNILEKLEDN